ncbi:MAG: alpha/beta hydrolase [Alphaproteobacteria bacterium]|nr:alpha/beta hydrolase [Alphaproteobacteria bacterium]
MLPGFQQRRIKTSDVTINLELGGSGPPLLLLHGYPQTHAMWHRVAPALAARFTVVAPDLRGYGDSDKPAGDAEHRNYSKRRMAQDQVELMAALGHRRFGLVGHDRGGRVAHRLALDHRAAVERLAVLDIVPTRAMFAQLDRARALGYYHWFFLAQRFDLPERLIGGAPDYYLERLLGGWSADLAAFAPEAMAEYRRCFRDPATIHATCEDYRAGAGIDLTHDEADLADKLAIPVLALWGEKSGTGRQFDVLACWRERASDVRGRGLPCGHFLAEEAAAATAAGLLDFFAGA